MRCATFLPLKLQAIEYAIKVPKHDLKRCLFGLLNAAFYIRLFNQVGMLILEKR